MYSLGIDPGWKNCGVALIRTDVPSLHFTKIDSVTFSPADFPSIEHFLEHLMNWYSQRLPEGQILSYASIERYVTYQGVMTAEMENICTVIGGIRAAIRFCGEAKNWDTELHLSRAADWKIFMAQSLAKNEKFNNPSSSLDKKFSVALAKHLTNNVYEFSNDHEADAVCIAAYPFIKERYPRK